MASPQGPPFKDLPPSPNLKHLKYQAKQLLDACRQSAPEAISRVQAGVSQSVGSAPSGCSQITLQQAQHVIAREYGFTNWSALCETLKHAKNTWGQYAAQYANEARGIDRDLPLRQLLDFAGKVEGLSVLDAGCGEGYVARILARQGAQVTGIDIHRNYLKLLD